MIPLQHLGLDADGRPRVPLVVVDGDDPHGAGNDRMLDALAGSRAALVVAVSRDGLMRPWLADAADICLALRPGPVPAVVVDDIDAAVATLQGCVSASPVAAVTLAWLLRGSASLPVEAALTMESAAYSMLLAGGEFRGWLSRRGAPRQPDGPQRVRVERSGSTLSVVLARPGRRNAFDAAMRAALLDALLIAEADPELEVVLTGDGPSFSAGGDLDEFGTAADVAIAHLIRVTASVAAGIHRIRPRVTARVHGVCAGAGVELPAFSGRLIAAPGTQFMLPEVSMGLIPGAGGTVSIPRRIGRHRTLWLALTATRLPAGTALDWGLVDAIE